MAADDYLLRLGDTDEPHGPQHVHGAQWLLAGHNVFKRTWYEGKIDGFFGEGSAKASRKCKYDLGYTIANVDLTFGPLLAEYLKGTRKRTPAMLLRARQRGTKFVWPLASRGQVIGWPGIGTHSWRYPPNNWESDSAWDIGVPVGTRVIATADGKIGPAFGPLDNTDDRFEGIRLHLETADNEFYYAHLKMTFPGVGPGVRVKQGAILGGSGEANGVAHLHFGVKHLLKLGDFKG